MVKDYLKILVQAMSKPLSMYFLGMFSVLVLIASLPGLSSAINTNSGIVNQIYGYEVGTNIVTQDQTDINTDVPSSSNFHFDQDLMKTDSRDKPSPQNYLQEEQIQVYKDHIYINVENVKWAAFADTKSMLPIINKNSNALQIEPKCPEEIKVGDIVSYNSEFSDGIIIHRVVYADTDIKGPYFILKGDNNPTSDPGKIRCEQIQRRVIGILY